MNVSVKTVKGDRGWKTTAGSVKFPSAGVVTSPPSHGDSKGLCHGDESEAAEIIVPLFVFPFH